MKLNKMQEIFIFVCVVTLAIAIIITDIISRF